MKHSFATAINFFFSFSRLCCGWMSAHHLKRKKYFLTLCFFFFTKIDFFIIVIFIVNMLFSSILHRFGIHEICNPHSFFFVFFDWRWYLEPKCLARSWNLILITFFFAVFGNQRSNRFLINPKSTEGLMKLLDTFLLSVTCRANIVLISSSVEQYLGHCRVSYRRTAHKNPLKFKERHEFLFVF